MIARFPIRKLSSGVPGLDEVLGGGIPELSFNLIMGGPGCGKTTLAHQIAFANASDERPALYVSIIGEPPIKMLRYQQQYSFFDPAKVGSSLRFLHLGEVARDGGLDSVLDRILAEVLATGPALLVIDSFRSIADRVIREGSGPGPMQDFVQRLALHLTSLEATTFLIGENVSGDEDMSISTVADGIILLEQAVDRNSIVRKLQVVKVRGQAQVPGLHTLRISDDGLTVFPRIGKPTALAREPGTETTRLRTGIPALDTMLCGGIPRGYSVMVAGPSGSGKTILSNAFIHEGARCGETSVLAVFERRPPTYVATLPNASDLTALVDQKKLEILYLRPLDLSIDEMLLEISNAIARTGATRAVLDSLSGLELALAPTFREDFRESLYRMIGALTDLGVTVFSTAELGDDYSELRLSPHGVAFLTDGIILQRYVEIDGELRRVLAVAKLRGSDHDKGLHEYRIVESGKIEIGAVLAGYEGLLTGRVGGKHGSKKSSA